MLRRLWRKKQLGKEVIKAKDGSTKIFTQFSD